MAKIRWLHLSDVHECDRESYHRKAMYEEIVAEVRGASSKPDMVFFTGDLAFSGKQAEYDLLRTRLLAPLRQALGDACPIFIIPGNHDVDRTRATKPRVWMTDAEDRAAFQKVDADGLRKRTDALLPRFEAYRKLEREYAAWGQDWLASEQGSVSSLLNVGGLRVAVAGINTAWLCHDNEDWGHLTAGRAMVEIALDQATATRPDLLIVLGHHPLAAMTGETDWSDGDRIRKRLEQAGALYLHGHLHASGGQQTGDSLQSALAIQAPSGFQAGDSKVWRNGVMWGEADLELGQLAIEPKRWNDDNREYVFDSDAAPSRLRLAGRDAFAFALPGRSIQPDPPLSAMADGWEVIDRDGLARKTEKRPSAAEMSDWFDGQFPRWEVALAQGVRPRQKVEDIARRFEAAHGGAPQPRVVLLTGAGGEGKSAALLQTAARLLNGAQAWTCLWRSSAAAEAPEDLLVRLEQRPGHAWLVVVDDAENVAHGLARALRKVQPRTDIHLALAARDADWSIRGATDTMWSGVGAFSREVLAGLDAEDARRIADGWVAYGEEAMGNLRGRTAEQAAKALLGHAQEQAARKEEGALLGALLISREGEDLKARVTRLMEPWAGAAGIGDRSLLDIYALVAAMHAENQLYLSRPVLALALGCSEADLDRGPLRVLRREAMVDGGTTYVLTRHRRIAEAARNWLVETGYDVDGAYTLLASAAERNVSTLGRFDPDIARWRSELVRNFVDGGRYKWPVAVAVAKAQFDAHRKDAHRLMGYASTLRRTEQPAAALDLFRQEGQPFVARRDVRFEWGVAAGLGADDYGLDVWLAAASLADDRGQELDETRCKLSLAGLGVSFRELQTRTGRAYFATAQAACGRLGLILPELDAVTEGYFDMHAKAAPAPANGSVQQDIDIVRLAVIEGSYETHPRSEPVFYEKQIGDPDGYRYRMLQALLTRQPFRASKGGK